jgi:hypothetical protein
MLRLDEHHVVNAGLQRDGFARLDFEPALDRPHFHFPFSVLIVLI